MFISCCIFRFWQRNHKFHYNSFTEPKIGMNQWTVVENLIVLCFTYISVQLFFFLLAHKIFGNRKQLNLVFKTAMSVKNSVAEILQ